MRLLGVDLSGAGLPFISARAKHGAGNSAGTVVCETQEHCDAVAAWAARNNWNITTRVATADEVAEAKRW